MKNFETLKEEFITLLWEGYAYCYDPDELIRIGNNTVDISVGEDGDDSEEGMRINGKRLDSYGEESVELFKEMVEELERMMGYRED